MPRIIFLSLLFFSFFFKGYTQNIGPSIIINWDAHVKTPDSTGVPREVLHFEGASYKPGGLIPSFSIKISGRVTQFALVNPVYEALTEEENRIIANSSYIPSPHYIETGFQSKRPVSFIYFVPIRQGALGYEKLISFEYTYTTDAFIPLNNQRNVNPTYNSNARISSLSSVGSSVLSTGDWYKLAVSSTGILKIDYNYLQQIGINPGNIDPRQIKIYGNASGMLPQANSASRADDLLENAIYVQGETDGVFNSSDYILFYAKSPHTWSYNATQQIFTHVKHLYSEQAFYFLTIGPGNGLRVADQPEASGPLQTITTFDDYDFYENDITNILKSGREWYGDIFDFDLQKSYPFNFSGITPNTGIRVTTKMMANSPATSPSVINTSFTASVNGNTLGNIVIPGISINPGDNYPIKGKEATKIFPPLNSNLVSSSNLNVTLTYNKSGNFSAAGYFNYIELNVIRDLKLYGSQTIFRSVKSTGSAVSQFVIKGSSNELIIWDVTKPTSVKNQLYSSTGSQDSFTVVTDTIKEYVMFTGSNFSTPTFIGKIKNQNLHGINNPDLPDMVIVTAPEFKSAAQTLANFRYSNDKLDVIVTTTDEVYNEFSSGAQDVTAIRDFMKMLYDRGTGSDSLKYLLLFGDCSYDYKNKIIGNTNYVPVYESMQSLDQLSTYSSDDYFALLDNNEGTWSEPYTFFEPADIGVGRLPVKNSLEAMEVVNKIIHYNSSKEALGKWRNKLTFISDDLDANGNSFLSESNGLAATIETNHKNYNIAKIYMDAYYQVNSPSGESAPLVNQAISEEIDKGTFLVNYVGHGGETQWAQEDILDVNAISRWENYNKLPFFITATCDFGRYDDPSRTSGAEAIVLKSNGGGIGLLCSTRPVYSSSNNTLNAAFLNALFAQVNGKMQRLGEVIIQAKTNDLSRSSIYNRNYGLLADPSMMLEYPEENIVITKINNNSVSVVSDTIKALSKVNIKGEVRYNSGSKMTNFNGSIYVTVYDKPATINTFPPLNTTFKSMNNFIYEGIASVQNGDFSVTFVVPKDISYAYNFGKISLYASKNATASDTLDAAGYYSNIVIGGTSSTVASDNKPPVIRLFMHDTTFVFGGVTNSNTILIAKISDENGINVAGEGIGHEIAASLDNSTNVFVLNEFYSSVLDNYQQGIINFPIKGLSPGNHSLKLKAWDTYNNSSEGYLEFVVANNEEMALQNVLNYPNPFSTHTNFHFDHNRAGDDIEVLVSIYTVSGKLIKTLDNRFYASGSHISDINWDGKDDFGDNIGKGVYVYKLHIRSLRDGSNHFKYQKLVILN